MPETNTGTGSAALLAGAAGNWKSDPAHTTVELHTKAMWGLAKVKGTMTAIEGSGTVSEDAASRTFLWILDYLTPISTNNKKRDEHLRGSDFFEVVEYPTLTYSVTGVTPMDDGKLKVSGSLAVHGRTHPLESSATAVKGDPGQADPHRAGRSRPE